MGWLPQWPWEMWWLWTVAALALGILEAIVPGYVFLGFGFGAGAVGLGLLVAPGIMPGGPGGLMLVAAVVALLSWLVLRAVVGRRPGQVKYWDRDINDD
ncbi:hypothetical protein [Wenxinia saemankumensis]|uniref:NfeD-like C-terminal, partner-binding n=1 Tax=Wenxinia saemankumensis TaxID=1447782 RepID=A0A1M6CJ21_9RHOB|nr:hypothetical protein [Wenxinia saemankumensis]SHI60861.1 hypothetical protein SAMN05444417_1211 [Wenxinia saemankumensis]